MTEKQGMIAEALDFLREHFVRSACAQVVHEDERKKWLLLPNGNVDFYDKQVWMKTHSITHIDDLIVFLTSDKGRGLGNGKRVCFVNREQVKVDLAYESHLDHWVTVPLTHTPEYKALLRLSEGVTQEGLFSILYATLADSVSEELIAQIREIRISKSEQENTEINAVGMRSKSGESVTKIRYRTATGDQEAQLQTDWLFTVPLWNEWGVIYHFETRVEVDVTAKPLRFKFHIRNQERVIQKALSDIVNNLHQEVPGLGVYRGRSY